MNSLSYKLFLAIILLWENNLWPVQIFELCITCWSYRTLPNLHSMFFKVLSCEFVQLQVASRNYVVLGKQLVTWPTCLITCWIYETLPNLHWFFLVQQGVNFWIRSVASCFTKLRCLGMQWVKRTFLSSWYVIEFKQVGIMYLLICFHPIISRKKEFNSIHINGYLHKR